MKNCARRVRTNEIDPLQQIGKYLDQPRQDDGLDDGAQSTAIQGQDAVVSITHIDGLFHGVVADCANTK
jgi:hypothetical protein